VITWTANRYAEVQAVLADPRCTVSTVDPASAVGTIAWLRASASRFTNGTEHAQRRARITAELDRLNPTDLTSAAAHRTAAALTGPVDVMTTIARQIPTATLAAALGHPHPDGVAAAAITTADAYFPGASAEAEAAADRSTAWLVDALAPAGIDTVVAHITIMVQACAATAGLIGTALYVSRDHPTWPTDAVLRETLRHSPPLLISRRTTASEISIAGQQLPPGTAIECHIADANRDPAMFPSPNAFDPDRAGPPSLTFGHGVRSCPGQAQALALAAGVVDTIRLRCMVSSDALEYLPSAALRIPRHLEVTPR